MGRRREIDQKVLFIYRYGAMYGGRYFVNKGYFINNQGRKIDYDFSRSLEIDEDHGMYDEELLEVLEEMEGEEGEVIFSEREVKKLYDWLYKIDADYEIEHEFIDRIYAGYELLGIRYKEDGRAEIIQIFETGSVSAENKDPYALKVREVLLHENPIYTDAGKYFDK